MSSAVAARAGKRVLVAETGRDAQLPRLLGCDPVSNNVAGRTFESGIRALRIDPFQRRLGTYIKRLQRYQCRDRSNPGRCK